MSNLFFSCGCQYNGEIYDNTEEWLAETICYRCQEEDLIDEIDQECAPLVGSEKQIAWAKSLRAKAITILKKGITDHSKAQLKSLRSETSAKKIIETYK